MHTLVFFSVNCCCSGFVRSGEHAPALVNTLLFFLEKTLLNGSANMSVFACFLEEKVGREVIQEDIFCLFPHYSLEEMIDAMDAVQPVKCPKS